MTGYFRTLVGHTRPSLRAAILSYRRPNVALRHELTRRLDSRVRQL